MYNVLTDRQTDRTCRRFLRQAPFPHTVSERAGRGLPHASYPYGAGGGSLSARFAVAFTRMSR